jgi:hypothetical protein
MLTKPRAKVNVQLTSLDQKRLGSGRGLSRDGGIVWKSACGSKEVAREGNAQGDLEGHETKGLQNQHFAIMQKNIKTKDLSVFTLTGGGTPVL